MEMESSERKKEEMKGELERGREGRGRGLGNPSWA